MMIRPNLSQFSEKEKGAAMVEFAIVLPLLLMVIFGVIEWGLYMYNRQVITNAAREGARHGVLMRAAPRNETAEDTDICNRVIDFAGTYLVTFGTDTLTCGHIDIRRGDDPNNPPANPFLFSTNLAVNVDYNYDFLFLSTVGIGPLTIRGESTMKME